MSDPTCARRPRAARLVALPAVLVASLVPPVLALPAFGRSDRDRPMGHRAKPLSGQITVSAAASLTGAFTSIGRDFGTKHRGTTVTFNFGSSTTLARQIRDGAPVDLFASADGASMRGLVTAGQVMGVPVEFAANRLTMVVKPGNPKGVSSLADLAEVGIVALCAPTVPCGTYAARTLRRAGVTIPVGRVTLGPDVKATLTAVSNGDADAGIVYLTDALGAGREVQQVRIPRSLNVLAIYPIAVIETSPNPRLATAFVRYVTSDAGRRTLRRHGFLPPPE